MKIKQWKTGWGGPGVLFLAILLLAFGLLLGGCESDSVAPHDELPQLTEKEAAQQAALVAAGMAKVGPELLRFRPPRRIRDKDLGVYEQDFSNSDYITGTVILEYFTGGDGGAPSLPGDADFGHLFTWDDPVTPDVEGVTITLDLGEGLEPVFNLNFEIQGDINQATDTATVSGSGTMTTGAHPSDFTFTDLVLTELSSYPDGGEVGFTADSIHLVVEYDGDETASVLVNDVIKYEIDLDTGIVIETGG